ncbi:MAG: hypothetical protein AAGG38_11120 [Planctomycetota bacterium]
MATNLPPTPDASARLSEHPPTADELADYLETHRAAAPSAWVQRVPLMALGGAVLLALLLGGPAGWVLPWLAFTTFIIYQGQRVGSVKLLGRRLDRAQDLVMLRHHGAAWQLAWRLIPRLVTHPALQHRAVAVLARSLSEAGAHDAAMVAYDRLLEDLPDGHPGAIQLRVQRAIASLFTEQLSDADDALRRLRGPVEPLAGSTVGAAYRLACLFQAVQTAHYREAIEESDGLVEALRPLGVDAGYGHALLAWCHRQRGDEAAGDAEQARSWWARATTLLPHRSLVARFPLLGEMSDA